MSAEAAEGVGKAPFIFVDRDETILDPNLSNLQKIGTMARLCYRVEPKENENTHDVDCRIVKKCIKDGHESILEHGAISVFINSEATEDSKRFGSVYCQDKSPLNFSQVFMFTSTDAQMKYLERFMDPELYDKFSLKHNLNTEEKRVLPCLIGDCRTWRQVIRERIFLETNSGDKVALALTLKILNELYTCEDGDVFFGDMVENIENGLMKEASFIKTFFPAEAAISPFAEGEPLTLKTFCSHLFADDNVVIAGQSSSCASVSVIFTTDRSMSHQHVRHRKNVGYSQESQRYVNYDKKGIRIIPLTMEPSKFLKWCEENGKPIDDIFEDYDLGRVRKDKLGACYFIPWYEGCISAANAYQNCVDLHRYWGDKIPDGCKTQLPQMPPETARDKLENDTATRLGVTWLRTSGFMNFVFWRLESHAQYSIRSALARMLKKMIGMNHPFVETLPHGQVIRWLENMKEQKLFKDTTDIDKFIEFRKMIYANVQKYMKEHAAEMEQMRK